MAKTLDLYLIEDDSTRVQAIRDYFSCVNKLLNGDPFDPNTDYPECHRIFLDNGYESVQVIHIKSGTLKEGYFTYNPKGKWVTDLQKYLDTELKSSQRRIFMIDLALNKNERRDFSKDENSFRAVTAKIALNLIAHSGKEEVIIIESILGRLNEFYKSALDITEMPAHIRIKTLSGNYFSSSQVPSNKVLQIDRAFNGIL